MDRTHRVLVDDHALRHVQTGVRDDKLRQLFVSRQHQSVRGRSGIRDLQHFQNLHEQVVVLPFPADVLDQIEDELRPRCCNAVDGAGDVRAGGEHHHVMTEPAERIADVILRLERLLWSAPGVIGIARIEQKLVDEHHRAHLSRIYRA